MYKRIFKEADWETISKTRRASRGEPLLAEEGLYEVFLKPDSHRPGYFVVTVFQGRSLKPYANYTYQNMQKAGEAIDKFINNIKEYKARKEKNRAERKVIAKTSFEKINVGDIFYSSWGYDQTNINFYQVIEKKAASVIAREIGEKIVPGSEGFMSENVVPDKDRFIGAPFLAKVSAYGLVGKEIYHAAYPYDGGDSGLYQSHYA